MNATAQPMPSHINALMRDVLEGDTLVKRNGTHTVVTAIRRTHDGTVQVITDDGGKFELDLTYGVRMLPRPCHCGGDGKHYGRGEIVNNVFTGRIGVCYGCHGKGWQDMDDVHRNRTYWRKYARVSA